MRRHIVQSKEWGEVKSKYGTPAVSVGGVQYTLHKIPFSNYYFANCPKVDPFGIDWDEIKESAKGRGAFVVNFDVPNVIKGSDEFVKAEEIFKQHCVRSPRDTFAKANVLLDLAKSEDELLADMHKKHRYNIGLAQRNGVAVKEAADQADFDVFYDLLKSAADRQKYYVRPKSYYQIIWNELSPKKMAHILTTEHNGNPLSSWMLFRHENTLYYPYGGSSERHKNLFASNLIGWEAIKLGKRLGCSVFDMWGAATDPNDKKDPYHGFTNFKLKFGGKHVVYIDSYDLVVNKQIYDLFNAAQDIRWKILNLLR